MIDRPWLGFTIVSGAGLSLLLLSALSASDSVLTGLAGVIGFFLGWVLISGVVWLAGTSAAYAILGSRPAWPRRQLLAAAQLIAAGIQIFSYIIPNAAASLTWEPRSRVLNFFIVLFTIAGPALVALGVVIAIWALVRSARFRGKTSVRIVVMHMQGSWPVWFDNDVLNDMDEAPVSEELKRRGIALSELFESSTRWDDQNTRYEWLSDFSREQFNSVSRAFAQDLATELGPRFFVATEVQPSNRAIVRFELETSSAAIS